MAKHTLFGGLLVSVISLLLSLELSFADEFSLFHPTPDDQLRPLSTDRPDITESPYTVNPGRVQLELDFISFTEDEDALEERDFFAILPTNFKVGLLHHTDLQLVFEPYIVDEVRDKSTTLSERRSGIGDVTLRLKQNLWGNDGGASALAVMPFLTLPTSRTNLGADGVEAGLIIPFALELGERESLGLMAEFDLFTDELNNDSYHVEFVNTAVIGIDFNESWGMFLEFVSIATTEEDGDWQGLANTGFTYALSDNFQLDGGIAVGVNDDAPDWSPFIGMAVRI